jgi:hypothetical protein
MFNSFLSNHPIPEPYYLTESTLVSYHLGFTLHKKKPGVVSPTTPVSQTLARRATIQCCADHTASTYCARPINVYQGFAGTLQRFHYKLYFDCATAVARSGVFTCDMTM